MSLLGIVAALQWGCGDGPGGPQALEPGRPPVAACVPDPAFASDTTAPRVTRVFPENVFFHDRDGDGLVDLELAFDDGEEGAGVEPASVALAGPGGRDLLPTWEVTERSAGRLVVEETIAGLLPHGREIPIAVTVVDRACNRRELTITLGQLRPGALHRSIDVGDGNPRRQVEDLVINPEGTRLFAVDETAQLTVVDPNTYELVGRIQGPVDWLEAIEADWEGNRLFAVGFVEPGLAEFDATTGQPIRRIETSGGAFSLAISKRTSEIYIPLEREFVATQGFLSVVDRVEGREVAVVEAGLPPDDDNSILGQHGAVVTKDESMLYVSTAGRGLHVWAPRDRAWLEQIDVRPGDDRLGSLGGAEIHGDVVYAVGLRDKFTEGSAAYRVNATTVELETIRGLGPGHDINALEVSPSGRWVFISGFGGRFHVGPPNYLLDAELQEITFLDGLPRPFIYNDAAWHPDGKRVYVTSTDFQGGNRILVYLVRPDA